MINIKSFKLPIEYIDHKKISDTIKNDLELICYKNENESNSLNNLSLYKDILKPTNLFSNETANLWSNYFTTNVRYLIHTQEIIKKFKMINCPNNVNFNNIFNIYENVTNDKNFIDKYQYIDIEILKKFNNNEHVLQTISVINLTSPLLSLLIPIILLIIPLFIFRLYGLKLNVTSYFFLLKQVFSKHPIGQVITNFTASSTDKKVYLILTFAFYLFQMFQNARSCYKFYKNLQLMHDNLNNINKYIDYTLISFDCFGEQIKQYPTYESFNLNMNTHRNVLINYRNKLNGITSWKFSINKLFNIGTAMKNYYILNNDIKLKEAFSYSFGFHGFIDNLKNLNVKLNNGELSLCKFNKKKTKFKRAYYPIIKDKLIKNTYNLKKKLLITGPNASGKTTILKTTLLNIIFSQQIGMGFYESATIKLYTHLHCYLNIPDTSSRDSLFQAEARRCKDIIDDLSKSLLNENHFCIFDELYSGTNPYEAITSSIALLKYLYKHLNLDFALTTHFLDVCNEFNNNNKFKNCCMRIIEKGDDFQYTYKLINGISQIKGGVKVLKDLEYPSEIVEDAKQLIKLVKI